MIYNNLTLVLGIVLIGMVISCNINKKNNKYSSTVNATITINYKDSLEHHFKKEYVKGHLPGFVLSIFTADSVHFMKGYGYANINEKKPINENTVQGVASISKTLIAIGLMKLVEKNKLNLNEEINNILPFKVINPHHKNSPITLKHLATHTSSINDEKYYDKSYVFSKKLDKSKFPEAWEKYIEVYNANELMSMEEYLKKVFEKGGEWATANNFLPNKPGTKYEYSNIGASLLAYCIAIKTGKDFKTYTKELILDPLKMNRSGWSYETIDQKNHITYYNESYNPVPHYKLITYPDGGLYATVSDLTKYLQEMMKGYQGTGSLLQSASYKEMMTNQIPTLDTPTGIIWDMENPCCIGHAGNDFGIATMMFFDPKTGIGKILFTNISIEKEEQSDQFYSIFGKMFKYDSQIAQASK